MIAQMLRFISKQITERELRQSSRLRIELWACEIKLVKRELVPARNVLLQYPISHDENLIIISVLRNSLNFLPLSPVSSSATIIFLRKSTSWKRLSTKRLCVCVCYHNIFHDREKQRFSMREIFHHRLFLIVWNFKLNFNYARYSTSDRDDNEQQRWCIK